MTDRAQRAGKWALCVPPVVVVALTAMLGSAAVARGATYYVRGSGNDGNDGLSPETAFASIQRSRRLLRNPGDRVIVGPGDYHEGNVQPHGSGTPDAPIIFFADVTGEFTNDPPGPVRIVPPNTFDANLGFVVYGRHDIYIEGFEIDSAAKAGIQIRPNSRTGVDSTRITIRNNTVRGCHKRGVQITAAGDVTVMDNWLEADAGVGLALTSGASGALRPLVSGNLIEGNDIGIGTNHTSGGAISENTLRSHRRGALNLISSDSLSITNNEFLAPGGGGRLHGANLEIADNIFQGNAVIGVSGQLAFARNRIEGGDFGFLILADRATVLDSQFMRLYITGGAELDFERNDVGTLDAKGVGAIRAMDNRFTRGTRMLAASTLAAQRNRAEDLVTAGSNVVFRENDVTGTARIRATRAAVADNAAGSLVISNGYLNERGAFLVEGNVSRAVLKVEEPAPDRAVVRDNIAGGKLKAVAQRELTVTGNHACGISSVLSSPDSRLLLAGNTSLHSANAGLVVLGAGTAILENNTSSESAKSGLAARRTNHLTIAANTFRANPSGGISVQVLPAGDCNRDLQVTVNEILTAVGIAMGQRPLHDCKAADVDGNGRVTMQEIRLSVAAALNSSDIPGSHVEISSNRVEENGRFGIDVRAAAPASATGNRVVRNGGIPIAVHGRGMPDDTGVIGNVLGLGGGHGVFLREVDGAKVRNNIVVSNSKVGILLRAAPRSSVVNNLVYANGRDGITVGLGTGAPSSDTVLMNNTLYENAGWGIRIGRPGAPSTGTTILNNILERNKGGGIAAGVDSLQGLTLGFNLNDDGISADVLPAATDFIADPQFVAPAGVDGVLGGEGFADDDFHLQPTSPAIDAGSAPAAEIGITGSAVAGQAIDDGIVDLGYHYGADAQ